MADGHIEEEFQEIFHFHEKLAIIIIINDIMLFPLVCREPFLYLVGLI